MVDRTENETNTASHGTTGPGTSTPERADKATSFDFKLRLGSRESTAALADCGTGEIVQLQPIDWESLTGLTSGEDHREYQTDSELQSIIVELAKRIATPEELEKEAQRQQRELSAAASATAAVEADASAIPPLPPTPPPPLPPADVAAPPRLVAPVLAPPPPPGVEPDPVDVPMIIEQTQNPSVESPVLAVNAAPVVGEAVEPVAATLPGAAAAAVTEPAITAPEPEPVAVAAVVQSAAVPVVTMTSNAQAIAAPPAPALQLAKIERRPDMGRPTKPVDFHALLGQAGLQPAAVKKRKKRHPFRVLFKLILVLAMLGAGAFYGKKYVLDKRWSAELKPFAEDVANERDLAWKKSVEVVELRMKEYAPKLAASVYGADPELDDLASEWRAVGLLEGELDLAAIGFAAAPFRPVFYDPNDGVIYEVGGIAKDLREFYLDDALAHALLDQHVSWGEQLTTLSPSQRSALLGLIDGDARAVTLAVIDPSDSELDDLGTEMADIANDQASSIGAMRSYPVDLLIGAGGATSGLFAPDVFEDMAARTDLLRGGVQSDAAVFDVPRGIDSDPISLGTDTESAGMMYWYYVLAGRIDDVTAWNAATAWNGDLTAFEALTIGRCVSATISTSDESGRQVMLEALTQWAAASPVESQTTVVPEGSERIEVVACDPGVAADTMADGTVTPWGFAGPEFDAVSDFNLAADEVARSCTVNAIRAYGVHQLNLAGDPSAATVVDDVQSACADA